MIIQGPTQAWNLIQTHQVLMEEAVVSLVRWCHPQVRVREPDSTNLSPPPTSPVPSCPPLFILLLGSYYNDTMGYKAVTGSEKPTGNEKAIWLQNPSNPEWLSGSLVVGIWFHNGGDEILLIQCAENENNILN